MNIRSRLQAALLTAVMTGCSNQAPPKAAPSPAPVAEPRSDWHAHVESRLKSGMGGLLPRLDDPDPERKKQAAELLRQAGRISALLGPPLIADLRIGSRMNLQSPPRTLDLRTDEGRADYVLLCMSWNRECDLNKVLTAAQVLQIPGVEKSDQAPYLDGDLRWNDLVEACDRPRQVARCGEDGGSIHRGSQFMVNALTGECETPGPCKGRPLESGRTATWKGDLPTAEARAWAQVALEEHASVLAFEQHLEELRRLGAPGSLLAKVEQARSDEVVHTELASQLVEHFGGNGSPGTLTPDPARTTEFEILRELARSGCIAETLSAAECAYALEANQDPAVHRTLARITADETRHAALAWRTLAWGLPLLTVRERRMVLAEIEAFVPTPAPPGILPAYLADEARTWATEHVLRPALNALKATQSAPHECHR